MPKTPKRDLLHGPGTMSPAADQAGSLARRPAPSVAVEPGQDRVLSTAETAAFLGIHVRNLRRLIAIGEAPQRVRLSERRFGFRISAIGRWLDGRVCSKAANAA